MTLEMGKTVRSRRRSDHLVTRPSASLVLLAGVRLDGRSYGRRSSPNGAGRPAHYEQPVGPRSNHAWNCPMAMGTRKIGPPSRGPAARW